MDCGTVLAAERVALGVALVDTAAAKSVTGAIRQWSTPAHDAIARAVDAVLRDAGHVDPVMVVSYLGARGALDIVGGAVYIAQLIRDAEVAGYGGRLRVSQYIDIIRIGERARSAAMAAERVSSLVAAGDYTAALDAASTVTSVASNAKDKDTWYDAIDAATRPLPGTAVKLHLAATVGTVTVDFGGMFGVLWPGQIAVVAGSTNVGKTAVIASMALSWAVVAGVRVTVVTLEDTAREWAERFVAGLTGTPIHMLRSGMVDGRPDIVAARDRLRAAPLDVVSAIGADANEIGARVSDAVAGGAQVVCVDYLQAVGWGRDGSEYAAIHRTIGTIERAIGDSACAVVGSQLSRGDPDAPPELRRLRGSGAIEERARKVLLLHRQPGADIVYDAGGGNYVAAHRTDIEIAKNKGKSGMVPGHVHLDLGVWFPGDGVPAW